jgi:Transglycosylase SLT domain
MRRPVLLVVLLLAAIGAGAYLLLREDAPPSYSPISIEDDPYAYEPDREDEFERRAAAGHSHVVYVKSPDGVVESARRVARWRDEIEQAADEAGVDPNLIEGMVLLESAGRPDARASDDLEGAVGLTQILAETATNLLGMEVDVRRSERLTRTLGRARGPRQAARLRAQRAAVDERFDPAASLAATGRYLSLAMDEFGREDLAVVSYHMGIGNLQTVLGAYGDEEASYAQLFFDATPDRHPRAYRILTGLGDDSKTYLWRVLASSEIMRLYRGDRAELGRLARLHAAAPSNELVLHPPGETSEADLRPFPEDVSRYGLRSRRPGAELRPAALGVATYIGQGVRNVSGVRAPLVVWRTYPSGFAFDIRRRYRNGRQAEAFQFMLDRLQALNLIAWTRESDVIHITASAEGAELGQ